MRRESKAAHLPVLLKRLKEIEVLVNDCRQEAEAMSRIGRSEKSPPTRLKDQKLDLDFSANERNFVRTHGSKLSGAKRFTLLLAYLIKGQLSKEVQSKEIERMWRRMTGMLGDFNRKFTSDAKERGWVDTKTKGLYSLRPAWREILKTR